MERVGEGLSHKRFRPSLCLEGASASCRRVPLVAVPLANKWPMAAGGDGQGQWAPGGRWRCTGVWRRVVKRGRGAPDATADRSRGGCRPSGIAAGGARMTGPRSRTPWRGQNGPSRTPRVRRRRGTPAGILSRGTDTERCCSARRGGTGATLLPRVCASRRRGSGAPPARYARRAEPLCPLAPSSRPKRYSSCYGRKRVPLRWPRIDRSTLRC
jgi:hypothetical protein